MHIGFLTPEYVTPRRSEGGLANYVRKVGRALAARGHGVTVFYLSDQDSQWQDDGVRVLEAKSWRAPAWMRRRLYPFFPAVEQIVSSRRLAKLVWQAHAATPFDVFQATSYLAPGYALRRNGRVPVICRVSSYAPYIRSAEGRSRHQAEYLSDWLEVRQVLDAEAAFAPSQFVANVIARVEGFQPQVIRTPVDPNPLKPDPALFQERFAGKKYFLYFSTLSRAKGADVLAEVIPGVLAAHRDVHMVFVGRDDGLNGHAIGFEYFKNRCGPNADRVHYHPPLPATKLLPIIAGAHTVLMPSRTDNYPNACLEAQSQGVPVIAFDESSLEEMMIEGETGFLAKNGDAASLQAAIERRLHQSSGEAAAMRQRILDHVRQVNAEDRVGQLVEFYQNVVTKWQENQK